MSHPVLFRSKLNTFLILSALLLFGASVPDPALFAGVETTGRWTPADDWRPPHEQNNLKSAYYAIHLVLLPGDDDPYHSRILWWRGESVLETFLGGQWGWDPTSDSDDGTSYPDEKFDSLGVPGGSGVNFFCGSHVSLSGSKTLLVGGTSHVTFTYGENKVRTFEPGSGTSQGSWTTTDSLAEWRWYPTITAFGEGGRVAALSGTQHRHHRIYGARRNGTISAAYVDSVRRFAPIDGGGWNPTVYPFSDGTARPISVESHSFVEMSRLSSEFQQVLFGGRDENGAALNETWLLKRENNQVGDDYRYKWIQVTESGAPQARSDHSSVAIPLPSDTLMVVFGGIDDDSSSVLAELHVLSNTIPGSFEWTQISPSGSPSPSGRCGHAAVADSIQIPGTGEVRTRMIVFGGTEHPDSVPTDPDVWELRFNDDEDPTSAEWIKLSPSSIGSSPVPGPRFHHVMVRDPNLRNHPTETGKMGHATFLYGGNLGNDTYSDSLWAFWTFNDGTTAWELLDFPGHEGAGDHPGYRARHGMTFDPAQGIAEDGGAAARLYLFGGDQNNVPPSDGHVYVVDPIDEADELVPTSQQWDQWADIGDGSTLTGHSMVIDGGLSKPRVLEVFDPAAGTAGEWTVHPDALLYQDNYPPTFVVPRPTESDTTRLVSFSTDDTIYWVDIPPDGELAEKWYKAESTELDTRALTAVSYEPGKILLAGSSRAGAPVSDTYTLDTENLSSSTEWQESGDMIARFHHNLVLLPNGHVMAVGGIDNLSQGEKNPSAAIKRPEIWNPASGTWSGDTLALQQYMKNYHSTAILLPDGRVLSAGGENDTFDSFQAEIFLPPYIFDSAGNVAERPTIDAVQDSMTWGEYFTLETENPDGVKMVTMLRPGATTHSFDMNQRFVSLDFEQAPGGEHLYIVAPESPDHAPPGYQMLFVLGSDDGPHVPSVAQWVKLGEGRGADVKDFENPSNYESFAAEIVTLSKVYVCWESTADDSNYVASGPVEEDDLRYRTDAPVTESNWGNSSIPSSGQPEPKLQGTITGWTVENLNSCTRYYFNIQAIDDNDKKNVIVGEGDNAKTLCGGPGGGPPPFAGFGLPVNSSREQLLVAHLHDNSDAPDPQLATANTAESPWGVTVVETEKSQAGEWRVRVRRLESSEGLAVSNEDGVHIQLKSEKGVWETRARVDLDARDARVGLCAPREAGRWVILGKYQPIQVSESVSARGSVHPFKDASHSYDGDVTEALGTNGGLIALLRGDELEMTYEAAESETAPEESWFVLLSTGLPSVSPTSRGGVGVESLPKKFALYPGQPNPTQGSVSIRFDLPRKAQVQLDVYDIRGRRIARVLDGTLEPGRHSTVWNLRDDAGRKVAAGVYLYRFRSEGFQDEKKLVVIP